MTTRERAFALIDEAVDRVLDDAEISEILAWVRDAHDESCSGSCVRRHATDILFGETFVDVNHPVLVWIATFTKKVNRFPYFRRNFDKLNRDVMGVVASVSRGTR